MDFDTRKVFRHGDMHQFWKKLYKNQFVLDFQLFQNTLIFGLSKLLLNYGMCLLCLYANMNTKMRAKIAKTCVECYILIRWYF